LVIRQEFYRGAEQIEVSDYRGIAARFGNIITNFFDCGVHLSDVDCEKIDFLTSGWVQGGGRSSTLGMAPVAFSEIFRFVEADRLQSRKSDKAVEGAGEGSLSW
jgi:hypothetical protein